MAGQSRTIENNWEACQARCKYIEMLGCAYFSFWPDGGCHLQSKDATQTPADGWGADQVVSGPGDCRSGTEEFPQQGGAETEPEMPQQESHDEPAPAPPPSPPPPPIEAPSVATTTKALPPPGPADKCPGGFHMPGYGPVAIVPTGWKAQPSSGLNVGNVYVKDNHIVVPHMDGRAYFADVCTGTYNHSQYLGLNLLGKEMSFSIDLSHAGCGCNAAFYLTSMKQNTRASECYDFYCDANNVCGESCAEIDIMEANKHAFHSTLHTKFDHGGKGGGYGGGSGWNGPRDFTAEEYGPHARCIDTLKPFEITVSFPVNDQGYLQGMHVKLSQTGKSCPLVIRCDNYDGMEELSGALSHGMTPILSYWSAKDMLWMDGVGADHKGPCKRDDPSRCGTQVRMYDFALHTLEGAHVAPPPPAPSAPGGGGGGGGAASGAAPETTAKPWHAWPTETVTTTTVPCSITRKEDCTYSKCCADPGMQCYEKHEYWAACEIDCSPGVDPRDPHGHHSPWTCKELGPRTPGDPIVTTTTTPAGAGAEEPLPQLQPHPPQPQEEEKKEDEAEPEPQGALRAHAAPELRVSEVLQGCGHAVLPKAQVVVRLLVGLLRRHRGRRVDLQKVGAAHSRRAGQQENKQARGASNHPINLMACRSASNPMACRSEPQSYGHRHVYHHDATVFHHAEGGLLLLAVLHRSWDAVLREACVLGRLPDRLHARRRSQRSARPPQAVVLQQVGQANAGYTTHHVDHDDGHVREHAGSGADSIAWASSAHRGGGALAGDDGPRTRWIPQMCNHSEGGLQALQVLADPGMQCYEKNKYWAACEVDCIVGIDPRDDGIVRTPWTCKKIGPRTPGDPLITTTTTTDENAALMKALSDAEEGALSEFETTSVDLPAAATPKSTIVAKALLGTSLILTVVVGFVISRQACGRSYHELRELVVDRSTQELLPQAVAGSAGGASSAAATTTAATPLTAGIEEDVEVAAWEAAAASEAAQRPGSSAAGQRLSARPGGQGGGPRNEG
eukprot:CAMPEP_0115413694 /NCGR_PEP_ID=MMETSP0271-20121206/22204_1 /TAXON_ID=71861 /ORGANISM="Scrippsiella trochoidea, Strain CCMP3099" /LENGTH=1013 /DNA_ID=CAMNT_0002837985 /DNA_START=263 /DNA_END=3301 /DNA_ORIENTATION=+